MGQFRYHRPGLQHHRGSRCSCRGEDKGAITWCRDWAALKDASLARFRKMTPVTVSQTVPSRRVRKLRGAGATHCLRLINRANAPHFDWIQDPQGHPIVAGGDQKKRSLGTAMRIGLVIECGERCRFRGWTLLKESISPALLRRSTGAARWNRRPTRRELKLPTHDGHRRIRAAVAACAGWCGYARCGDAQPACGRSTAQARHLEPLLLARCQ